LILLKPIGCTPAVMTHDAFFGVAVGAGGRAAPGERERGHANAQQGQS
jgi:hypothetical protein